MITKETIKDFFSDIEEGNEFDTSNKLLWGYFFLDNDLEKLKVFSLKLRELGFMFKDIFEAEKTDKSDITEYYLHVERVEHHNINSLFNLNDELYKLANEHLIDSYDGFDVGNIISSDNIV